ncbi:MAG: adenylate/guanylate cyclase domain-containing protein [Thermodesulfobacteriota bacterium]
MGIKAKYAIVISGLLLLITSAMGAFMVLSQRHSMESQVRSMASTITGQFAENSKIPLLENDGLALNGLIQNLLKSPMISDAFVLNDKMTIEAHKDFHKVGVGFYGKGRIEGAGGAGPWFVEEDEGSIIYASPIVFNETRVGYTVVSFSKAFVSERVRAAVTSVIIITVLVIILGSVLSIPLASGFLRPVFRLLKGTKEIIIGNLDYRIPEGGRDEVGELVRSFNHMASELKKKEILKGAFNRYVSPNVADEILKKPASLDLGGDRRVVTVFFADIRDFTRHAQAMNPEETVEALNRYFTLITEIVFRFEGTIDKFIGDAVMCVFGSPIRREDHLEKGVKAAAAIRDAIDRVNIGREGRGLIPFYMGIGIDSGEVIAGNMGSKARMEYTAVGETVNMASRLSGLAGKGEIVISGALYLSIQDNVTAREMEGAAIKGIDTPVKLYSIVDLKESWKGDVDGVVEETIKSLGEEDILP